jgi:uncharacterized membrane protein YgaE (UPF0421/DUF939 family)
MTLLELYKSNFSLQSIILRRAIRMTICLAIASIFTIFMRYSHSFWLPLTVVIIMQPTIGGTLRKGLQRSMGTIIGILLGGLLLWLAEGNLYIQAILLLAAIFTAYYSQAFNQINYGIFVIPLTMMVVLLLASLIPQNIPDMLFERCTDTIAASILVVLLSYFLLPNSTKHEAALAICQVRNTIVELIEAIVEHNISPIQYHQRVLAIIQTNQRIWPEWIYENYFNKTNRVLYQQVVYSSEVCFETLAALKWQLVHATPEKKQTLINLLELTKHEFAKPISDINPVLQNQQYTVQSLPITEQLYFTRLQQAAQKLQMLETKISGMSAYMM